jgi:hypothetical protein
MKMSKTLLLTAFLSMAAVASRAQQAHFGIKGGFSETYFTDGDFGRLTGYGGIFVSIPMGYHLYLQPEILYAGAGGIYGQDYFNVNSPYNSTESLGYVEVPLMFQIHFNRVFYLEVGPQIGFLTSANQIYDGARTDEMSEYKSTDVDLNFGLGINFGPVVSLTARYNLGLTDISADPAYTTYNRGAQFGLAFKFPNHNGYGRGRRDW